MSPTQKGGGLGPNEEANPGGAGGRQGPMSGVSHSRHPVSRSELSVDLDRDWNNLTVTPTTPPVAYRSLGPPSRTDRPSRTGT